MTSRSCAISEASMNPIEPRRLQQVIGPDLVPRIDQVIQELLEHYRRVPGLILTEDDLKCQLFHLLLRLPELADETETADEGVFGSKVHTEVSWFDENNRLSLKPDLTITDPRLLSIYRPMQREVRLPTKGFHFRGDAIIFELKFFRARGGIAPRCLPSVRRDIAKLSRLIDRAGQVAPDAYLFGFVVVFAKFEGLCDEITQLANEVNNGDRLRMIVGSANCTRRGLPDS